MQMHVKFAHSQACVERALAGVESCLMSVEIVPSRSICITISPIPTIILTIFWAINLPRLDIYW